MVTPEHYRDNWPQYAEELRQINEREWAKVQNPPTGHEVVMGSFQRAVLRELVIMKMRQLRRIKSRFWPVKQRYW